MPNRWWGRSAGPAILSLLALPLALAASTSQPEPTLVVRGPDDRLLASVPLRDAQFTLRYRNSLYGSLAEERYVLTLDGRIALAGLAADELAVLEEYYAIDEPAARAQDGERAWRAEPATEVVIDRLIVAATDLGRRTLLVSGEEPLELWQLVGDEDPSVTLEAYLP
jgi:hypothetical protein